MPQPPPNPLLDMLALSNVPRWAIVDIRKEQSVADHSFRVAVIALELRHRLNLVLPLDEMLLSALVHDAEESRSGDIPPEYKTLLTKIPTPADIFDPNRVLNLRVGIEVGDQIRRVVKLADLIEAVTFIKRHGAGDAHTSRIIEYLYSKIKRSLECAPDWTDAVYELIGEIITNAR